MAAAQSSSADRVADPCVVVIFGALGDLTKRKLLPSLCNLSNYGTLPKEFAIVGVARRELSEAQFREQIRKESEQFGSLIDRKAWSQLEARLYHFRGELQSAESFQKLKPTVTHLS